MKELLAITCLTLFVLCEARPSENLVEPESFKTEGHVRVRRRFDYADYMDKFWDNLDKHTNSKVLNIGNGYKNRNMVHISGQRSEDTGVYNIGNGSKNTNLVYYGVKPASVNDPFNNPFFDN